MVTFKIVENAPPTYMEKYDKFVELYNDNSITVQDISKELGWSCNVFKQAKENALKEGKIKLRSPRSGRRRKKKREPPKHYSYSKKGRKFSVKKNVINEESGKSVLVYYGSYISEKVAERVVCELKKVDWDKNELDKIHRKIKKEFGLEKL